MFLGITQFSTPGPLLFNTFLCDFFLFYSNLDVTNCNDDNTPYSTTTKNKEVVFRGVARNPTEN